MHPIGDGTSAVALVLPTLLVALVLGTWVLMRQHDRRLCEHCMASMPLNPSETAARYGARFWVAHAGGDKRMVLPYLGVLLTSNFAVLLFPSMFTQVVCCLLQLSMIYLFVAYSTHRRLQPWCPQCKGGDHQDEEDWVAPDPVPSDHRPLV